MKNNTQAEKLLDKAIHELPFQNLEVGQIEKSNSDYKIGYSKRLKFDLCYLLHEFLVGEGSIHYYQNQDNQPTIIATCFISVQGDYKRKSELGIFDYLGGTYDIATDEWNFSVDLSMLE